MQGQVHKAWPYHLLNSQIASLEWEIVSQLMQILIKTGSKEGLELIMALEELETSLITKNLNILLLLWK